MEHNTRENTKTKQECIPIGCVPPAAVAVTGGLHTPPPRADTPPAGTPLEQAPTPPEQAPPPLLARSPSTSSLGVGLDQIPSTSPLAVGLDQIPLNFPLGCGPGDPPPSQIPLNFLLGCGPGNLQGMLGYHPPRPASRHAGIPPAMHAGIPPPPLDRQTPIKT